LFWTPATIHRVYVGIHHGKKDIQTLAFLQELFMALYGSGNLLIFFAFIVVKLLQIENPKNIRRRKREQLTGLVDEVFDDSKNNSGEKKSLLEE
jgi:hypothetical protein